MSTTHNPREAIREGASEVREKLKSDLSNISKFTRVRRFISLSPTMICTDCEGRREVACGACGGTGKQKVVWNDEENVCEGCKGAATEKCFACAGRGRVQNVHRKKFLWLLGMGGLAWAFMLFQLWGRDVAPEQTAKYLHGGGGGGKPSTQVAPRRGTILPRGAVQTPAPGSVDQSGNTGTPGADQTGGLNDGNSAAPLDPNAGGQPGGVRGGQMRPRGGGSFSSP